MSLLALRLKPVENVLGIYGKTKDFFPGSASFLHPAAADAFVALQRALCARVRVSDMLRTAESSLQAMQEKAGVQPPGFSAHNFGFAIDIDVEENMKRLGFASKAGLDSKMAEFGWFCHRRDGARGFEDWHYNHLGTRPEAEQFLAKASRTSTAGAVEAKMQAVYGDELVLTPTEMQEALAKMRCYSGDIDGVIGPRSKQALMAFQRAWKLKPTGEMDAKTERTLALVSADRLAG